MGAGITDEAATNLIMFAVIALVALAGFLQVSLYLIRDFLKRSKQTPEDLPMQDETDGAGRAEAG